MKALADHHDYDLAAKEWATLSEGSVPRCNYCKIPLKGDPKYASYERPVSFDQNSLKFQFVAGKSYGHPACVLAQMVDERHIHFTRATFLLHKYLRILFQYCKPVVKAPPREILPSFKGPLASFQHYGEILQTQNIFISHLHDPFYIPQISTLSAP